MSLIFRHRIAQSNIKQFCYFPFTVNPQRE